MGGNTDGTSGPGVGAVTRFVHEAGVGIMIYGVGEGFARGKGVLVVVAQDAVMKSKTMNVKNFFIRDLGEYSPFANKRFLLLD